MKQICVFASLILATILCVATFDETAAQPSGLCVFFGLTALFCGGYLAMWADNARK